MNIRMYFQLKILTKNEPQNCPKRQESVKLPPKDVKLSEIEFSPTVPNLVVVAEDVDESHDVFMKLDGETPPPEPSGAEPRPCGATRRESGCCGFSIRA